MNNDPTKSSTQIIANEKVALHCESMKNPPAI